MFIFNVLIIGLGLADILKQLNNGLFPLAETLQMRTVLWNGFELLEI